MLVLIKDIINVSYALNDSDGEKVYAFLKERGVDNIQLSFEGIHRASTGFLNAFVGRLLLEGDFSEKLVLRDTASALILKKIDRIKTNKSNFTTYNGLVRDALSY